MFGIVGVAEDSLEEVEIGIDRVIHGTTGGTIVTGMKETEIEEIRIGAIAEVTELIEEGVKKNGRVAIGGAEGQEETITEIVAGKETESDQDPERGIKREKEKAGEKTEIMHQTMGTQNGMMRLELKSLHDTLQMTFIET